jgi:FkbM family methyltransferase
MTFISYAQNFEDVMLWRALKHVEQGFYLDVGAAWPDVDSVTKAFYEHGWRGINIEPNPEFHSQLCRRRPRDINLKLAVGEREAVLTMNFLANPGLSTLDNEIAGKHQAAGWSANRQAVEVKSLATIWQAHVPEGQAVHFLKVDVEGLEEAVLKGNDWQANRPWVVVVEATLPMSQTESHEGWQPILLDAGYQSAYADGLNRFYVAREHSELLPAFKYPPNVFDDFKIANQQEAETQAKQAEARATQAETQAKQAEARATQAETQAKQAEARATQAETQAKQAEARLSDLLNSTSWRVTAPMRWVSRQVRLLRKYGLRSQCKALVKKVLRKVRHEILERPALKHCLIGLICKLGLYSSLKALNRRIVGDAHSAVVMAPYVLIPAQVQHLSPHGRRIYLQLKATIEHQQKVHD